MQLAFVPSAVDGGHFEIACGTLGDAGRFGSGSGWRFAAHGRLWGMVSLAQTPRSVMLNERLLIMRLITSIGLALLLMLGLAAAGHLEGEGSAPVPLVVSALVDPHVDPVASDSEPQTVAEGTAQSDTLAGLALCVLGVLCGLIFFVLTRLLRQRRPSVTSERQPRHALLLPAPFARPRVSVLSLPQLGLSRT